jgi:hypothetical protein
MFSPTSVASGLTVATMPRVHSLSAPKLDGATNQNANNSTIGHSGLQGLGFAFMT